MITHPPTGEPKQYVVRLTTYAYVKARSHDEAKARVERHEDYFRETIVSSVAQYLPLKEEKPNAKV